MNRDRRVITSVSVGLALVVLARAVSRVITDVDGGWFMYQPSTDAAFIGSSDGDAWATATVWLIAIGVWMWISWRLFDHRDRLDQE